VGHYNVALEYFKLKREKRYLITTADERTWKFDRPIIFLGEWCRIYNRKHIWENMDAVVAAPYGLGLEKKDADYGEARALEEKLFPEFYRLLNDYHGTNYGERFWLIVLGHWFRRTIDVLINRVNTLKFCLQEYDISGTAFYNNDNYDLATLDSYSAIFAFNDDRWNNALTSHVLSLLEADDVSIDFIEEESSLDAKQGYQFTKLDERQSTLKEYLYIGYSFFKGISKFVARDNDGFIINSYLPMRVATKLELALGQLPQFWKSKALKISDVPNRFTRRKLTEKFETKSTIEIEKIAASLLFKMLPVCYLEGWASLNKVVNEVPWPKNPRFIFTSNNFDTDESFKLWTAINVENGKKYYTGQHGNNYGTHRYINLTIEEKTSSKFITWGWADGLPQHIPAFCFKTAWRKSKDYNPKGGLLLIEVCLNHRITTWDGTAEYIQYYDDQIDFIKRLGAKPRENLTIRLHANYRYTTWGEEARWNDFDSTLKIETGAQSIRKLISGSRLVLHSYDSTGMLETLSANIPTLAFWQNGFDHLRDSAKPYYQMLVEAGVIHFSAESVAERVNKIWDDVDGWWSSNRVQTSRDKFCERYARFSKNPVMDLKKILNESVV